MSSPIQGASSSHRTPLLDLQDNETGPSNARTTTRQSHQRPSIFTGLGQPRDTASTDSNNAAIRTGRSTLPSRTGEPVQGRSPVSPGGDIIGNAQTRMQSAAAPGSIGAAVNSAPKSERDAAARAHVTMTVDLGAFRENFRAIKDIVKPGTKLSAVVKADRLAAARASWPSPGDQSLAPGTLSSPRCDLNKRSAKRLGHRSPRTHGAKFHVVGVF